MLLCFPAGDRVCGILVHAWHEVAVLTVASSTSLYRGAVAASSQSDIR